jgi:hypothetical protein
MAMTPEQKYEALTAQVKRIQNYNGTITQKLNLLKAENKELEETLREVYINVIVGHLGYGKNKCDCDPDVGIFGCTVCRVRAALNIGGE